MASARLCKLAGTIFCEYNLAQRQLLKSIGRRTFANKSSSSKSNDSDVRLDAPLKYMGSQAQSWKAQEARSGGSYDHDAPWYQSYVIIASISIFMLYFCVFREESDIDQRLNKSLYDHIQGLEEHQIQQVIKFNRDKGLDTTALEKRLKELRGE